jgi:hypothetical protein
MTSPDLASGTRSVPLVPNDARGQTPSDLFPCTYVLVAVENPARNSCSTSRSPLRTYTGWSRTLGRHVGVTARVQSWRSMFNGDGHWPMPAAEACHGSSPLLVILLPAHFQLTLGFVNKRVDVCMAWQRPACHVYQLTKMGGRLWLPSLVYTGSFCRK